MKHVVREILRRSKAGVSTIGLLGLTYCPPFAGAQDSSAACALLLGTGVARAESPNTASGLAEFSLAGERYLATLDLTFSFAAPQPDGSSAATSTHVFSVRNRSRRCGRARSRPSPQVSVPAREARPMRYPREREHKSTAAMSLGARPAAPRSRTCRASRSPYRARRNSARLRACSSGGISTIVGLGTAPPRCSIERCHNLCSISVCVAVPISCGPI